MFSTRKQQEYGRRLERDANRRADPAPREKVEKVRTIFASKLASSPRGRFPTDGEMGNKDKTVPVYLVPLDFGRYKRFGAGGQLPGHCPLFYARPVALEDR